MTYLERAGQFRIPLTPYFLAYRIPQGEVLPTGYAPAYRDWNTDTAVCWPVGLHYLARWSRALWLWLRFAGWPSSRDRRLAETWFAGYKAGYGNGNRAAWDAIEAHLRSQVQVPARREPA